MPLNKYFHGKGDKVMSDMASRYGEQKGKSVFYATANARKDPARRMARRPSGRSR